MEGFLDEELEIRACVFWFCINIKYKRSLFVFDWYWRHFRACPWDGDWTFDVTGEINLDFMSALAYLTSYPDLTWSRCSCRILLKSNIKTSTPMEPIEANFEWGTSTDITLAMTCPDEKVALYGANGKLNGALTLTLWTKNERRQIWKAGNLELGTWNGPFLEVLLLTPLELGWQY